MKGFKIFILLIYCTYGCSGAQNSEKHHVYMDIFHGQTFWNDPEDMKGADENRVKRVEYMTEELNKTLASVNADLKYLKKEIKPDQLADCDILMIHIPSTNYSSGEIEAIVDYLNNGGAAFVVMDEDYWSTLDQTNVNDIIYPFGIQFGQPSTDTLAGGYSKAGTVTSKPLKVTYHGGRIVKGGTPFCYNNQTVENPFGTFKELENGGKLIVMGDGMVSLYMTSWQGVNDYQCQEFMQNVFQWLLE